MRGGDVGGLDDLLGFGGPAPSQPTTNGGQRVELVLSPQVRVSLFGVCRRLQPPKLFVVSCQFCLKLHNFGLNLYIPFVFIYM